VDYYQNVMSDYFETMGIPIVQGTRFRTRRCRIDRTRRGRERDAREHLLEGKNPIGQRLRPCCGDQVPWFTVIGVAKDVKQGGIDQKTGTEFYFFIDQSPSGPEDDERRAADDVVTSALSQTIEQAVRGVDRTVPVVRLQGMDGVFAESIRRPRLLAQLIGGFAGLALLLAAVGTYGVLSFMVAERRREIGIRLALGADHGRVLGQVMKQGLILTAVGLIVGLGGALGLNRLLASLLFGVQPTDMATMVSVVATIAGVAAIACWVPAWRASRLDPNVVLREE
jgi:hypothetical protein